MPGSIDPTFNCQYFPPALNAQPLPYPYPGTPDGSTPPPIPPIPELPPGVSPEQMGFPYLIYKIRTRYKWKQGTLELPVAKPPADLPPLEGSIILNPAIPTLDNLDNPGSQNPSTTTAPQYGGPLPPVGSTTPSDSDFDNRPAAVVIQVSAPYGQKIVEFQAVRLGAQPVLPDPTPKNANEVLKEADTEIWAPIPTPDGMSFVWIATGKYVYHLLRPYWASDGYVGGASPVDNTTLDLNWYPSSQYDANIA